jgi:methionyl-tRNA synthetase
MGFSYDDFIRTSEPRHALGVSEIIRRIDAAGDLYTAKHEGWYCAACETFYTEKELATDKRCPVHETVAEWKSEENVFFRLSRFAQPLLDWYDASPDSVRPPSRRNEVRSFVAAGLRDLSVSRTSVSWAIPFPERAGHTVYVWLDALTNYVSALGYGSPDASNYETFWANDDAFRLHLIGKDILRFHAVYWPAFLMSAGLPLPSTIYAHGWWQRDGKKVSKSSGNAVRPDELVARLGADSVRYFLLREMVFGQDASFSDEAVIDRYNSDLANDLGNTASRVVTLARKAFDGQTPPEACTDNPLIPVAAQAVADYHAAMLDFQFHRALEALWRLLAEANQYLVAREPWKLIKTEGATPRLSRVLWNGLEAVRIVATGLLPFLPTVAPKVLAAVGSATPDSLDALEWGHTPTSAPLPELQPLFPRVDKEEYFGAPVSTPPSSKPSAQNSSRQSAGTLSPTVQAQSAGTSSPPSPQQAAGTSSANQEPGTEKRLITIDQFFETELRVATVQAAEAVPKSKKLLKLTLDVGEETARTVVAGIAEAYQPEDLVGKQVIVVANLAPAKLMGIESQGMVLAASLDGKAVVLHPAVAVPAGTKVK